MANTTRHQPVKQQPRPNPGSNEHNKKEHEERLAREGERVREGAPGMNEHNLKEHEEKLKREGGS